MESVYKTFWICLATIVCFVIGCITYNDVKSSAENDPRLACIKEHGDWNAWNNACTFTPQKEPK
jgi:hypothetical protein